MRTWGWGLVAFVIAVTLLVCYASIASGQTVCDAPVCTSDRTTCTYGCYGPNGRYVICTVFCPGNGVPCSTTCR